MVTGGLKKEIESWIWILQLWILWDHGSSNHKQDSNQGSRIFFQGSFKIVRNWAENKSSCQWTDVMKPMPLTISKVLFYQCCQLGLQCANWATQKSIWLLKKQCWRLPKNWATFYQVPDTRHFKIGLHFTELYNSRGCRQTS